MTTSANSGAGSLRAALASQTDDGGTVVTIESQVTDIYLSGADLYANLVDDFTLQTEGQTCTIHGFSLILTAAKGTSITLKHLDTKETLTVNDFDALTVENCTFTGTGTAAGGLGAFVMFQDDWEAPLSRDIPVSLKSCNAYDSSEDGVQIKIPTAGDIIVDIWFCEFANNDDDGLEIEDFHKPAGEHVNFPQGDIAGDILFCTASDNHNGFNINESGNGSIFLDVAACSAYESADSGIELKEAESGHNFANVSSFESEGSTTEGVLIRETDAGSVHVSLDFLDTTGSSTAHGVQVEEEEPSGSQPLNNDVLFTDIDSSFNSNHGFEVQVSGIHPLSVEGGGGSWMHNNGGTGLKLDQPATHADLDIVDLISQSNGERGVYVKISGGGGILETWIDTCSVRYNTLSDIELRHDAWVGPAVNACAIDTGTTPNGSYGSLSLLPVPDPLFPGAEEYHNWSLSDVAIALLQ